MAEGAEQVDELERKRREAEERTAAEGRAAAREAAGQGEDPGDPEDPEDPDEPQAEMFPVGTLDGDPKVTLKNIIKPRHRVEYTASLMSAEVPLRHGLVDPESNGQVLITFEFAGFEPVPIYTKRDAAGERQIEGWKIRQKFRPIYVEPVAKAEGAEDAA